MEDLIVYLLWDYEIAPGLYSYPHIYNKADYFLESIRNGFKLSDEDMQIWQNTLDELSSK